MATVAAAKFNQGVCTEALLENKDYCTFPGKLDAMNQQLTTLLKQVQDKREAYMTAQQELQTTKEISTGVEVDIEENLDKLQGLLQPESGLSSEQIRLLHQQLQGIRDSRAELKTYEERAKYFRAILTNTAIELKALEAAVAALQGQVTGTKAPSKRAPASSLHRRPAATQRTAAPPPLLKWDVLTDALSQNIQQPTLTNTLSGAVNAQVRAILRVQPSDKDLPSFDSTISLGEAVQQLQTAGWTLDQVLAKVRNYTADDGASVIWALPDPQNPTSWGIDLDVLAEALGVTF